MNDKKKWIYYIRGLAIIAVVVCHQQNILHSSEWIQMFSLYSVTSLIFLCGITRFLSLKKWDVSKKSLGSYLAKSLFPILGEYCLSTMIYIVAYGQWIGWDLDYLWSVLLSFSYPAPAYFIKYYIVLSLLSPIGFCLIYEIESIRNTICRVMMHLLVILIISILGYFSIGKINMLGGSFLPVYYGGLLFSNWAEKKKKSGIFMWIFSTILFGVGVWSVRRFYFARVAGNYNYAEGIDRFTPKLQMTPPNISIICYSLGVVFLAFLIFSIIENCKREFILKPLLYIGRYSMDIFLFHIIVENTICAILYEKVIFRIYDGWIVKWLFYYVCMFGVPIFFRLVYDYYKKRLMSIKIG